MKAWVLALAFLGSSTLAIAMVALVVGRDDVPTATYLVYTSEEQPLPDGGLAETSRGEHTWLSFEQIEDEGQLLQRVGDGHGVVLDTGTYRQLSPVTLREWRFSGTVLAVYGVDPAQVASQLEVDPREVPASGSVNSFVLLGGTDSIVGDPARIDRDRLFVGVTYRPPGDAETELGKLGWFQDEDDRLSAWLAAWALEAARDYGRSLD